MYTNSGERVAADGGQNVEEHAAWRGGWLFATSVTRQRKAWQRRGVASDHNNANK